MTDRKQFTRGQLFGREGGLIGKSYEDVVREISLSVSTTKNLLPNTFRDRSFIVPPLEPGQDDDDAKWLPDGWKKYVPVVGEFMTKNDISKLNIVLAPDQFHLPNLATLESYTSKDFLSKMGYPSLAQYYGDDHKGVSVKVIYATSEDKTDTKIANTRARVTGNKVEYGIAIRLNPPIPKRFNNVKELQGWIAAAYVHEKAHVRQMHKRHMDLLIKDPLAAQFDIERELRSHMISDEAEAYWAWMTYGKLLMPSWFSEESSPFYLDLKAPFLKLQKTGMDPLIDGEPTNHPVYDEKALETLWLGTVYFYLDNVNLVEASKTMPKLISTIEICNREGLITNREFEKYLAQVDTFQARTYHKQRELHHNPNFRFWSALGTTVGIAGLGITSALLFRMFGRMRE